MRCIPGEILRGKKALYGQKAPYAFRQCRLQPTMRGPGSWSSTWPRTSTGNSLEQQPRKHITVRGARCRSSTAKFIISGCVTNLGESEHDILDAFAVQPPINLSVRFFLSSTRPFQMGRPGMGQLRIERFGVGGKEGKKNPRKMLLCSLNSRCPQSLPQSDSLNIHEHSATDADLQPSPRLGARQVCRGANSWGKRGQESLLMCLVPEKLVLHSTTTPARLDEYW